MRIIGIIIFSCILTVGYTQQFEYTPSTSKLPSKRDFEERMETNLEIDLETLSSSKKNKNELEELLTDRVEFIGLMATEEDEYIFGTPLNEYMNVIFNNLIQANPQLDAERLQLFVSRDMSPNASCFGEGSIVMNIGLIRRLENEAQIAFVLAHELAHYEKDHVNEAMINHVEVKNDRETQKKIKEISKMKYNRNQAGLELLKDVMYDSSRHTRYKEGEADAIGAQIMVNAGYDPKQAVEALKLLDTVDQRKYNEEVVIHREFNRELYPFKPEWKEEENPLAIFFEEVTEDEFVDIDVDSLKTHPKSLKRAERIAALTSDVNGEVKTSILPQATHENAVMQADFDFVLSAYHYKNYGAAIYESLQLQQKYPDHPFLVGIIGACMGEMAEAIDDHELGKILPASSPEFTDDYNELLAFLNNLSMNEMIEVGYNYVRIYADDADKSGALAYGLAITSKLKKKNNEKSKYKSIYNKNFNGGYFTKKIRRVV